MNEVQSCPVCGAAGKAAAGPRCESCGFEAAFVRYFSSPESAAFWRAEVERLSVPPMPMAQARLASRLFVGPNSVGICLDDACYTVSGTYGVTRDREIVQTSLGARHSASLRRDGTVAAQGNNDFGECEVRSLHDVRQVIAGSGLTLALRTDGRVQLIGRSARDNDRQNGEGELPILSGFDNVIRLAYGGEHLAVLTSDGRVRVQEFSFLHRKPARDVSLAEQASRLSGVKDIAAGQNFCTLALLTDGGVRFIGTDGDRRDNVSDWKDITAVGVDSVYAVGLTADGHVRLAGSPRFSSLDAGRSQAADWENVAAIACGHSIIAAVTIAGQLLLAGDVPREEELLSSWERDVRPAVKSAMRG
jgi:alpha-tubulin suppressor-like RCC1 family protein